LVPFFHTREPSALRQLSIVPACANATTGAARAATSTATVFSFFMFLLSMKAAA
jgi:hypothetical protein